MGSEGNFEVSFPKRSTSLLSSKQDLSNHLFFLFREFLGFFNTGKPDLTGNVGSATLKTTSERSLTGVIDIIGDVFQTCIRKFVKAVYHLL